MSEQQFWQALDQLIRGTVDYSARRRRNPAGFLQHPGEPSLYEQSDPWPLFATLRKAHPVPSGPKIAADDARYPRYVVDGLLAALVYWGETYDCRQNLENKIAKLESELAEERKEHSDFVKEFCPKYLKQCAELDHLKQQCASDDDRWEEK